jgi:hypothetical protein
MKGHLIMQPRFEHISHGVYQSVLVADQPGIHHSLEEAANLVYRNHPDQV